MLKKLKIALLIVILAEEIRSARKRTIRINVGIDEKQLAKIVNLSLIHISEPTRPY